MLTAYLLTKNNEKTIEGCLKSIRPFVDQVVIGDQGSTDQTVAIARSTNCIIYELPPVTDYAEAKNNLVDQTESPWILWLEPWETLSRGQDSLKQETPGVYSLSVLTHTILSRQTRLWHRDTNTRFENPIYETVYTPSQSLDCLLFARPASMPKNTLEILQNWKQQRFTNHKVLYYESCYLLGQKQYTKFVDIAQHFLHTQKKISQPVVMTRYHLATVQLHILKQGQQAMNNLLWCLSCKPDMAELWCLLGDAFLVSGQPVKAEAMYANAIDFGSQRLKDDDYPIDISKYRDYPKSMIEQCKTFKIYKED